MPTSHGEKLTLRILDRERNLKRLEDLGINKLEELKKLLKNRTGLILVCGATGSGKTTTLYSIIQYLDRMHRSINTIEDPIEYRLSFCNQAQVNTSTGFTFSRYTKTILRHDPDVVIVGETRDAETANNIIHLADTGHLAFTTLHTNDIRSSISRLLGMDVNKQHLASVLRGGIVQRLARKICPSCQKAGCPECMGTGYKGMTLLVEFAQFDSYDDIDRVLAGDFPIHTFAMDAALKLQGGITDRAELERVLGKEMLDHELVAA